MNDINHILQGLGSLTIGFLIGFGVMCWIWLVGYFLSAGWKKGQE
jgi:hypothetical protein